MVLRMLERGEVDHKWERPSWLLRQAYELKWKTLTPKRCTGTVLPPTIYGKYGIVYFDVLKSELVWGTICMQKRNCILPWFPARCDMW